MASLTEVYEGGNGASLRRLYAGVALFGVGAALVITGIVVASTDIGAYLGLGLYESREVAGVLGGIGFPIILIGTMTVLPKATRGVRVAAGVGAAVCLVGVGMFSHWYPVDWVGASGNTTMTLVVTATYFAGAFITSWSLFSAVANFKARNDPGGTVKLEITKEGKTKVVEVSNDDLRSKLGGIGVFGGTPDGNVETQTNQPEKSSERTTQTERSRASKKGGSTRGRGSGGAGGGSFSESSPSITDGGATTDDAEFLTDDEPSTPANDSYCGNCTHFRYARTDDGLVPYCGLYSEAMDDMDACEEWTSNT